MFVTSVSFQGNPRNSLPATSRLWHTMAGEADGDHAVDSVVKNVGIESSFTLPCGYRLSNRLVKAAMTEVLADPLRCEPNQHHERLYVWHCV